MPMMQTMTRIAAVAAAAVRGVRLASGNQRRHSAASRSLRVRGFGVCSSVTPDANVLAC